MDESFGAGGSPTATMVVDGEEGHHEHNEMRGVANGDVWLGSEAVRKGLADVVMTSDEYLRNLMATGDGLTRPTKAVNAADDDASTTTTTTTKTTTTTTTMATTAVAALPMKKGREIEKAEEEKRKRAKYTERALVLELKKKKEQTRGLFGGRRAASPYAVAMRHLLTRRSDAAAAAPAAAAAAAATAAVTAAIEKSSGLRGGAGAALRSHSHLFSLEHESPGDISGDSPPIMGDLRRWGGL
jgi:ClpP class serine protease